MEDTRELRVTVSTDFLRRLKVIAFEQQRPVSKIVREVLEGYVVAVVEPKHLGAGASVVPNPYGKGDIITTSDEDSTTQTWTSEHSHRKAEVKAGGVWFCACGAISTTNGAKWVGS